MKMLKILSSLALVSMTLFSCSKDNKEDNEPDYVNLNTSLISIDADGGSQSFTISTKGNWIVSGGSGWVTVSPSSGTGQGSVSIQVQTNNDLESRSCTLTVTSGTASSSVKVEQRGIDAKLAVDVNSINLGGEADASGSFNITSNTSWSISTSADWLTLSSENGNGNSSIKITANSRNNTSSEREAIINITGKGGTITVKVIQKGLLVADCRVKPDKIVTLADAMATNWKYESNVAYYYWYIATQSNIDRMTEDELVKAVTELSGTRATPRDNYISSFRNLNPNSNYYILSVAFNSDGKRGDLVKTPFRTKSNVNQPIASFDVDSFEASSNQWSIDIKINAAVDVYYVWPIYYDDWYDSTTAFLAWVFMYGGDKYIMGPFKNSGSFNFSITNSGYVHAMTWAKGVDGEYSGIIDRVSGKMKSSDPSLKSLVKKPVLYQDKDILYQEFKVK